jgi:hypothetical protein
MAITDTGGGAANNSNNAATYASGSFTPAAGDRLLTLGGITDTALDIIVTDSQTLGWTALVAEQSGILSLVIAIANNVAAASSMTTTYGVTGDNGTGCMMNSRRLTNVRAIPPFHRQVGFASGGAGTTPTVVMPKAFDTNNAGFGVVLNLTNSATTTAPPSGWSEIIDAGHTSPDMGEWYGRRLSGETASTITWTATSATAWIAAVVEIYEVNQPGKIPRVMHHRHQMIGDSG